jgi:hypothetical protein
LIILSLRRACHLAYTYYFNLKRTFFHKEGAC